MAQCKVIFNIGEEEFIEVLQSQMGLSYLDAVEHVIRYKKEQMFYYEQSGNTELAEQIRSELGET